MSNKVEDRSLYIPKGGMCLNCQHKHEDCSKLPFHEMKVIKVYPTQHKAVLCTSYKKKED